MVMKTIFLFTDETDEDTVTFTKSHIFSDGTEYGTGDDENVLEEENQKGSFDLSIKFEECDDPEILDPVLTNPLPGTDGKEKPKGKL